MREIRKTVCNRDCPDACAIVAHVEDGKVTRLGGDPDHPVTGGFLCWRTNNFLPLQYAPDRLTQPLLRGKPVSWDEALDFAAGELLRIRSESGPAAIFHYRSGGSLGALKHLSDHFFARFGPAVAVGLAERLHDGPCAILVGWGMARRQNGGAIVRALDALSAVTGNLGVAGGGVSYYFMRRKAFDFGFVQKAAPRTILEPLF